MLLKEILKSTVRKVNCIIENYTSNVVTFIPKLLESWIRVHFYVLYKWNIQLN